MKEGEMKKNGTRAIQLERERERERVREVRE